MIRNRESIIQTTKQELERTDLKDYEREALKRTIQECQSNIENIEEVTTIEIGATTNDLIDAIQKEYQANTGEYGELFERFINSRITGLTPDGKHKEGLYIGQSACLELGINDQDLMCLKGQIPVEGKTEDIIRQLVNANYGTNIPLSGVVEQAQRDYDSVKYREDEVAKAKALMHLKEVQRDAGILRNGGAYYTLTTDQTYQDAKAICSGKTL